MKFKFNGFVFRVMVMSAVLVVGLPATEATETYVNKDIGFSFDYPASWQKTDIKGGNIVVMFTGGVFNRNVQVMYETGGEEAGKASLERLATILKTQKILSAEWIDVNGHRSFLQVAE